MKKDHICLHVYPTSFTNETRILKITHSLEKLNIFDDINVVAIWAQGLPERETFGTNMEVQRIKLRFNKFGNAHIWKVFQQLEWMAVIIKRYWFKHVVSINCHTLGILPLGVFFKLFKGAQLVYEPHELETERHGLKGIFKIGSKIVEKLLIKKADLVIMVSDSIAGWYRHTYGLRKVYVIQNVPYCRKGESRSNKNVEETIRNKLSIREDALLFLYIGNVGKGRNIELLLDTFKYFSADKKHLIIMGFGPLSDLVRSCSAEYSNIHYHESVPPDKVIQVIKNADVGFSLLEDSCLNHRYALPNKLFEYVFAGIPVIGNDFPEQRGFIEKYNCGWVSGVNKADLFKLVSTINKKEVENKIRGCLEASDAVCWEREEQIMSQIYSRLKLCSGET